ncbi:hypothetical protein Tsubulata_006988 [Turnera subulata]|uniref:BHLH domain-containing protein n=1 Tax=Turnera subulata TaxID=218843 RepID=A0A9Q0F176_9ROSI|nr:hypothetical protein Tsubulata_006988 [Turnera subulata]
MELPQHGFLEELLLQAPRKDSWSAAFASGDEAFFSNGWNLDSFEHNMSLGATPSSSSFAAGYAPTPVLDHPVAAAAATMECPFSHDNVAQTYGFVDDLAVPEIDASSYHGGSAFPAHQQEEYPSVADEDEELGRLSNQYSFDQEGMSSCCKVEMELAASSTAAQGFNMNSFGGEKKNKGKKLEGQPSKNLMAERRRRKRLNDRLSMLRSIVPKISKMDRTSILGDTIDYMKELLDRINKLQQEEEESEDGTNEVRFTSKYLKDLKSDQVPVRNSPKFQVERREMDTRVDICCSVKPGLLLSTVNTLEALGLEIQQCVISCFNDFSMQASCSEAAEQRTLISPEDIKQALFRSAGYGGRCP